MHAGIGRNKENVGQKVWRPELQTYRKDEPVASRLRGSTFEDKQNQKVKRLRTVLIGRVFK